MGMKSMYLAVHPGLDLLPHPGFLPLHHHGYPSILVVPVVHQIQVPLYTEIHTQA